MQSATILDSTTLSDHHAFHVLMQQLLPQASSTSQASSLMLFRCAKALQQSGWHDLALLHTQHVSQSSTSAVNRFLLRGCSDKLRRAQATPPKQNDESMTSSPNVCADISPNQIEPNDDPDPAAAPVLLEPARLTQFQYVLPMSSHETLTQSIITSMYSSFDVDSFLLAIFSPPSMFSFFPFYRGNFHILPRSLLQKHEGEADGENAQDEALLDEEENVRSNSNSARNNNYESKKNQRKQNREHKKQKRKQEAQLPSAEVKRQALSPSPASTLVDGSKDNNDSVVPSSSSNPPINASPVSLAATSSQTSAASGNARRPRRTRHAE